jgi:hypothetical protein
MSAEPQYDLTPLMAEIESVIKEGVHKIVKKQLKRNRLLEKTHRKIMELPSVLNELKRMKVQVVVPPKEEDWIQIILERLNAMEERYTAITKQQSILEGLLNDMQNKSTNSMLRKKEDQKKQVNMDNIITLTGENPNGINDVKKIYVKEEKIDVKEVYVKKEEVKEEVEECEEEQVEEEEEEQLEEEEEEQEQGEEEEEVEEEEEQEEEQGEEEEEQVEEEEQEEEEVVEEEEEEVVEETVEEPIQLTIVETKEPEPEPEPEEEEEEYFEIEIDDITYFTNDEVNGFIYDTTEDGYLGDKVGVLKDGEPTFY